jgi:hypothetical protein
MRNPAWEQSLEPKIAQARDELRARDPREIAERSGAVYYEIEEGQGRLQVRFFGQPYTVTWPDLEVFDPTGQRCSNPVQAVLLQYLVLADGTPLAQQWVSLRELPNGAFYERAFQSYSGNLVARAFKSDIDAFREAALQLGGEPIALGDAAFRFWALPKIPLALVYWSGGEEFPASAQVLFDASAGRYHHLEMLAHLGAMICDRVIAVHREDFSVK